MSNQNLGPQTKNINGQKFGRMTVLKYAGKSKYGYTLWECQCDCGTIKVIPGCSLTGGLTKSCGCWRKENTARMHTTHSMSQSRTYKIWGGMVKRCTNPKCKAWNRYGGRGISVCDRWLKFENFLADMGMCPDGLSLERKENNGNYELGNCVWATKKEQARNCRKNHLVTFQGKTLCLVEWAEITGIHPTAIRYRLKTGWSIEKALTTPSKSRNPSKYIPPS